MPTRHQVFISYSHQDKTALERFRKHLRSVMPDRMLDIWDDSRILAGDRWRTEIENALAMARVAVLLISTDFLASSFIVKNELQPLLQAASDAEQGTVLLPIIVGPVSKRALQNLKLYDVQAVNSASTPLYGLEPYQQDLEWIKLAERIDDLLAAPMVMPAPPLPPETEQSRLLQELPSVTLLHPNPPAPVQVTPALPPETEQNRLLRELSDFRTTHPRRLEIGERLNQLGDTRPGIGVQLDGTPDIVWLPVAPSDQLPIEDTSFTVSPFYIAKYQITNAQYQAFYQAHDGYNNPKWWRDMPAKYQRQKLDAPHIDTNNNPRDNVSWYQSVAFARWLQSRLHGQELVPVDGTSFRIGQNAQVRLPTDWEWQWVAQNGIEGRKYPWGNWLENRANTKEAGLERSVAVGMYPDGAASCGAQDMAGNVWEWCLNKYDESGEVKVDASGDYRVLRGGAFNEKQYLAASANSRRNLPLNVYSFYGLRLVVSAPIANTDG